VSLDIASLISYRPNVQNASIRSDRLQLFYFFKLDAGKFSFGNRSWDEWSRLPSWIFNEESVNKFREMWTIVSGDDRGFE